MWQSPVCSIVRYTQAQDRYLNFIFLGVAALYYRPHGLFYIDFWHLFSEYVRAWVKFLGEILRTGMESTTQVCAKCILITESSGNWYLPYAVWDKGQFLFEKISTHKEHFHSCSLCPLFCTGWFNHPPHLKWEPKNKGHFLWIQTESFISCIKDNKVDSLLLSKNRLYRWWNSNPN